MGTAIQIIIGFVIFCAIAGAIFSKPGEKEDGAKVGAAAGFLWVANLLPYIVVIALIILAVKACS